MRKTDEKSTSQTDSNNISHLGYKKLIQTGDYFPKLELRCKVKRLAEDSQNIHLKRSYHSHNNLIFKVLNPSPNC